MSAPHPAPVVVALTPSQQHAAARCAPLRRPVAPVVVPDYQARGRTTA